MRPWAKTDWPRWDTLVVLLFIVAVIVGAALVVLDFRKP